MMRWIFEDAAMVDALGVELASWEGTGFFPRQAVRGVAADCIQFAIAPLQALALVGAVEWPRYSVKGGGPELLALIQARIEAETCLRRVWQRGEPAIAPLVGDVWLADAPIHLAISGPGGELWQSLHPAGVQHGVMSEALRDRLVAIYRAEALA